MARRIIPPRQAEEELDNDLRLEREKYITSLVANKVETAKVSISGFFNFVAREENTKQRIQVLPHQQLLFDFVQAHPKCVIFMPPGGSKTFCTGIITLFLLGQDPTERGAIVSATQGQAAKPLMMVRDYIESSKELRFVFGGWQPSTRRGDPWTQTAITVARPPAIRDPSLVAVGIDGALPGSRLSWLVIDDILDRQNTATKDQRDKVFDFVETTALSRIDLGPSGRVIVTNTAHHPDDAQHRLIKKGGRRFPALKITLSGNIYLYNTDWDTPLIRPSVHGPKDSEGPYRLVANDKLHPDGFDEHDELTFWPTKFTKEIKAELKRGHTPRRYLQLYEQQSSDKQSQRCHEEWLEKCKVNGLGLVDKYDGPYYTATGVDLAVEVGEENDYTAFVTVEFRPNGVRRILDVEIGQWNGPTIVEKILRKARLYKSVVRVENNAAQDYILQFTRRKKRSVRIVPHTTGRNKAHPEFGVEGIFIEFMNGAWELPCDEFGSYASDDLDDLMQGCLDYQPSKHTHDGLMALWFAVEQGRKIEAFSGNANQGGGRASIMTR
jgi:hypothetical protein